jgi:hypothetical protein
MNKESRAMFDQALDMLGTAQLLLRKARAAEEARDSEPKTKGGFAVGDRIQHKQNGHMGKNWHGKVISLRPPKGFSGADIITVQWDEGVGSGKHGFPATIDRIEHENPKQNKAVQDSAVASDAPDCRHWSKL